MYSFHDDMRKRRKFIIVSMFTLFMASLCGLPAQAQGIDLVLEPLATGLTAPVGIENAGDREDRLFIVEQGGTVRIVDAGTLLPTPFLEVTVEQTGNEQGLLGLAFHPQYGSNGTFFVHYSEPTTGDSVIARFLVSANPNIADPLSEERVLTVTQPLTNHNGGQIAFGPDGMLYIALGDGGGGGDPDDNGQFLGNLLGTILRIDVDSDDFPADPSRNYAVPTDNPFVGDPFALDEIWFWGLRNPWRFSFDRLTGDLFIGDVGQGVAEEINLAPAATSDLNFGWDVLEATSCFEDDPGGDGACADFLAGGSTLPILEYRHVDIVGPCCAVTGGFRYRGPNPTLAGLYLYAEYSAGIIWAGTEGPGGWTTQELLDTTYRISSFGEDTLGRLYLLDRVGGTLYHVSTTDYVFADGFESGGVGVWSSWQ